MAKRIEVFLIDDYADWEIGPVLPGIKEFLNLNAEIVTFNLNGREVKSMGGLTVHPDCQLSELDPKLADLLILPGSDKWREREIPEITDTLKLRAAAGKPIAGICGATVALAQAGLLDDRQHTSNSLEFLKQNVPGYKGQAHYLEKPSVRSNLTITAPGTAPIAFAADIFRLLAPDQEENVAMFEREFRKEHG